MDLLGTKEVRPYRFDLIKINHNHISSCGQIADDMLEGVLFLECVMRQTKLNQIKHVNIVIPI